MNLLFLFTTIHQTQNKYKTRLSLLDCQAKDHMFKCVGNKI